MFKGEKEHSESCNTWSKDLLRGLEGLKEVSVHAYTHTQSRMLTCMHTHATKTRIKGVIKRRGAIDLLSSSHILSGKL